VDGRLHPKVDLAGRAQIELPMTAFLLFAGYTAALAALIGFLWWAM
jgi:hypothetical protein